MTREQTAAALLEVVATVAIGDLVTRLEDATLRDLYGKLMARCVEIRDDVAADARARGRR
jgi:hypothetical protein